MDTKRISIASVVSAEKRTLVPKPWSGGMRIRIVSKDWDSHGRLLGNDVNEYDTPLLQDVFHWCSSPMVKCVAVRGIGENYVEVTIDQVVD